MLWGRGRRSLERGWLVVACVALASGCGDPSTGSPDAGTEDAAVVRDDGGRLDAGAHDDAGGTDAAAVPDGGPLECEAGYAPVDGECVDVDECATDNGGCDPLTSCTNTAGSRTCGACPAGYSGDGEVGCTDVDECAADHGGCDPLTSCTNTIGSRTCGPCPADHTGTGESGCVRIECGNGVRQAAEECDDGDPAGGDGCDALCRAERTHDCAGGTCVPICGDGAVIVPSEQCDDGNLAPGDGCSASCTLEPGFLCTDAADAAPPSIRAPIVYRDFRAFTELGTGDGYTGGRGHTDFERFVCGLQPGLVQTLLDATRTPLRSSTGTCITSAASFGEWYADVSGVNRTVGSTLALDQNLVLDPSGRTYQYDAALAGGFFPLDGLGYGNTPGRSHNFHFTSVLRTYFAYRGGEAVDFTGDDDVWIFVNGRLAVDLGGVHSPASGSVTLASSVDPGLGVIYDPRFDLLEGGVYELAVFHAERHTTLSNYRLTLARFLHRPTTICAPTGP